MYYYINFILIILLKHILKIKMKKTITLLTAMIFAALSGYAQYYYIPSLNPGMNPGGLNNDIEQPGATGWTVIKTGGNASPAWSSNAAVPFTFNFNGAPVTTFKVSTSGVLTFDVAAVTPPATNNAALPDASVPNNSICVWGLEGSGANDEIRTKTFGVAPNRQHWIQFNSYTAPGFVYYSYWAIMLEETTNSIYIVDQRTPTVGPVTLSVGIQINNATAISVAGSPNLAALTGPTDLDTPADNAYYEFAYGVQNTYDTKGQSITLAPYLSLVNAPFSITGTLQNRGSVAITSMDLNYSINNGATVTANVAANVASGAVYSFTHPTSWNPGVAGAYVVKFWASNINNGNADQYPADDNVSKTINIATTLAQRNVLFEQFTSSTCGPCASANPGFNAILDNNASKSCAIKYQMNYPAVGDPCYTQESTDRHDYYGVAGIPHVNMTGLKYSGHPAYVTQAMLDNDYDNNPGLFAMNVSFQITGSTLTAYVTSTAQVAIASNNLKLHVVVVEDHVTHSPQSNGETDFYDVMRKMLPNSSGTTLAAQISGQVENKTLNYTIPAGGGAPIVNGELRVVAFIQDNLTKEVFQAAFATAPSNIKELTTGKNFIAVYPNPFTNSAEVSFTLEESQFIKMEVYNVTGELIASSDQGKLNAGRNYIQLDGVNLSSGIYFVGITAGENTYKQKVIILK